MAESLKILLIDDDEDDYVLTEDILSEIENFDFKLEWQPVFQNGLEKAKEDAHDICFVDYRLGESDGIDLIQEAVEAGVKAPFILLTGKGNREVDKLAMDRGAADFLVKSELTPEVLERSIRYALKNRQALQLVMEGEEKFRQLFERSIDAIYIADNEHQLVDVNSSFRLLFGENEHSLLANNLKDYFVDPDQLSKYFETVKRDGQVKDFEAMLGSNTNKPKVCQLTCVQRTDYEGKNVGYQGIIRDMTYQKKAEMELLMAEKLSVTGKIARSIAHEVRNPLTNLSLALGQLEDELPKDNEDFSMFLGIIDRNANRIGQLITEMLNSSKPKELQKEDYHINILLEETLDLVRDRLTLKSMSLDKKLSKEVGIISIDADKLKMAILNIMVNAIEAMEEEKGVLTIETKPDESSTQIIIADNGCGISKDDLNTLFDPFYTNKQGGMGLGLTSTQNIINSHGGSIEVQSEVNKGTTFIIILPNTKGSG